MAVLIERVRQIQERNAEADRRIERIERAWESLLPLPVLLQRMQQDMNELKTTIGDIRDAQTDREQWLQNISEARSANTRASALTVVGLFLTLLALSVGTITTIVLHFAR